MKAIRILCLILAVLMIVPLLFACAKDPESGENNDGGSGSGSGVLDGTNAAGETWPDDGLGTQDFGGRTIRVLNWSECPVNEFEMEEKFDKSTLTSAVYTRNENVKARMNVSFSFTSTEGSNLQEQNYASEAQKLVNSSAVDLFSSYSRAGNIMMVQGLIRDLRTSEYIDFSKPWWSQGLIDNASIWGKTYFCAGDLGWTLMGQTAMICFNKNMLAANTEILNEFEVSSIYELVEKKKWTLPNMIKISRNFEAEGEKDGADTFGCAVAHATPLDAFYKASDLKWMEKQEDGSVAISNDQHSNRANEVVKQLVEFFKTASGVVNDGATDGTFVGDISWNGGRTLFYQNAISAIISGRFSEKEFAFGVLPMPMFDENQEAYKTCPGFYYSLYSIPRAVTVPEEVCCVLECLASEGYRHVAPAFYSETLRKQSSDSVDDYKMWETIKNSIEMDGGRLFDWQFEQCRCWGLFRSAVFAGNTGMTEQWERYGGTLISEAKLLNTKMKTLEKKLG